MSQYEAIKKENTLFWNVFSFIVCTNNVFALVAKRQTIHICIHHDRLLTRYALGKYPLGQIVEHIVLDGTLHRSCTKLRIVTHV